MSEAESLCPVCHYGKLQACKTTYTQVYGERFIVVPNVSTLVCDVCGEKIFDHDTLLRLSGLLGVERRVLYNGPSWPSLPRS
jgi:YgiT-type zinc finger domain-containing protein